MSEEMLNLLKQIAGRSCYSDDPDLDCVDDYAGGNVDDAFSLGVNNGEVTLARSILTSMGVEWR